MQQIEFFDPPAGVREACRLQRQLARKVLLSANVGEPRLIGALDSAYGKDGRAFFVGITLTSFPDLEVVEQTRAGGSVIRMYGPDLAFFQEARVIRQALHQLQASPDVLMVHGHGIMHPRRCGRACHIGIEFGLPTIGCSRRHLAGSHKPVGQEKGAVQPVFLGGRAVGVVMRTRDGVKPLYVSPGHRCDMPFARDMVLRCLRGFRMPEPLRLAHLYANKYKRRRE